VKRGMMPKRNIMKGRVQLERKEGGPLGEGEDNPNRGSHYRQVEDKNRAGKALTKNLRWQRCKA